MPNNTHATLPSGAEMPLAGFGTYMMRGEECVNAVHCAIKVGYRLIDTARIYRNEKEIGQAMKQCPEVHREELFLTSKIAPTEQGEEEAYAAIQASIADLCVTYLDLVLIHWPGKSKTPVESEKNVAARRASWRGLIKAKKEGLVRDIGVSNFMESHLEDPCFYGPDSETPAVNQFECHPLLTHTELREYCKRRGIHVQAYSSLAQCDARLMEHPALHFVCADLGGGGDGGGGDDDLTSSTLTTPHSVLLKWALLQDIAVIPRSRKPENIEANWQAMTTDDDGTLSDEHFELLSGVDEGIRVCWDPSTVR